MNAQGPAQVPSLDDLYNQRDAVPWYWRVVAFAASWMILGGYLIFPSTFDHDAQLRFSASGLSVLIVALLTAGYCLTGLLWFAVKSWMFHAEAIFLPALGSSALGVLTVMYDFLSSSRYHWNAAATIMTVLSASSTVGYGALVFLSYRRISNIRKTHKSLQNAHMWRDSSWSNGTNTYYSNWLANMHPTVRTSPVSSPMAPPQLSYQNYEDEQVNAQMRTLLLKTDPNPSPGASSSTFRIDLPGGHEDEQHLTQSPRGVHEYYGRASSQSSGYTGQPTPNSTLGWSGDERGRSLQTSRDNSLRSGERGERARSRELREMRRRQIEMGL